MERQYRVKLDLVIYAESWEEAQQCADGALANCDEHGNFGHVSGIGLARGQISFEPVWAASGSLSGKQR